jgi:hypothetical protein
VFEAAQRLAGVGRDHVCHLVEPRGGPVLFFVGSGHFDVEARFHCEVVDGGFHQFLEFPGSLVSLLRKRPRRGQVFVSCRRQLASQLAEDFVLVLHLGELACRLGTECDHVVERGAVLAF